MLPEVVLPAQVSQGQCCSVPGSRMQLRPALARPVQTRSASDKTRHFTPVPVFTWNTQKIREKSAQRKINVKKGTC